MDNKTIKYIGFYDLPDSTSDRVHNLAAINKMNYISSAINKAGYNVEIISPSWMGDKSEKNFENQKTVIIDDKIKVTVCPSWITKHKLARNFKILFSLLWLIIYLLLNTKKDEKIIVYHVQWVSIPIRIAKFLKRFKLILEVEEIYGDVMIFTNLFVKWEQKLLDSADSYIYSTDLLVPKLSNKKPYVVVYGEYKVYDELTKPPHDGRIHLLYAGIIDNYKRGAFNALEATRYLPENFILHIIGFGEVEKLNEKIKKYNEINKCKVIYDGVKTGEDYIRYAQNCHIGLSTQSMNGEYLESSFPSKILSYLSVGLRVVSCNVECVSKSKIGDIIYYYNEDDPKNIADAILDININKKYDSKNRINELNNKLIDEISLLLRK